MKYDLGTIEVPTIIEHAYAGERYVLSFDTPPDVRLGETYRTKVRPLSVSCDAGAFLALWLDGNTLHVKAIGMWTPCKGHVVAAEAD